MEKEYLNMAEHLSLKRDDVLLVTGDILRLAVQEKMRNEYFDMAGFIGSFKAQLPDGALLFHAFNDRLVSGDTFDYRRTRPTTGALSVAAWKDPEFVRTHDPFHSFMVWGRDAGALQWMNYASTFGTDSVFGWLHRNRAKMLFIDVSLVRSFTFVHYCEESVTVPYRKHRRHRIRMIDEAGRATVAEKLFYTRKCGYYNSLDRLEEALTAEGILTVHLCDGVPFKLMDLAGAYDFIARDIRMNRAALLHGFSYRQFVTDVLRRIYRTLRPKNQTRG
ncbi:MAG: AAC(3) family N-acetyltransferase [Tannerella sp.]|nr:AAC(3) family N-acetyltransferase [Tannerella sp.]